MKNERDIWTEGTKYQILLRGTEASGVVEDWYYEGMKSDVRVRKAKTKGCVVVETTDTVWAHRIVMTHPGAKVNIVKGVNG